MALYYPPFEQLGHDIDVDQKMGILQSLFHDIMTIHHFHIYLLLSLHN